MRNLSEKLRMRSWNTIKVSENSTTSNFYKGIINLGDLVRDSDTPDYYGIVIKIDPTRWASCRIMLLNKKVARYEEKLCVNIPEWDLTKIDESGNVKKR